MIYRLIAYCSTPLGRRSYAALSILLFPLIALISLTAGTLLHLWDFARNYTRDLKDVVTSEYTRFLKDMVFIVKTGKRL